MIKRAVVLLPLLATVLAVGCAKSEGYVREGFDFSEVQRVAIVDVEGAVRSGAAKNQIADYFAMELLKRGYHPIERKQVKAILSEQEFQAGEFTTAEGAARAGRILNVGAIMVINIPRFEQEVEITSRLIDVEDGSLLWVGSGSGSTRRTLATIAGGAVGAGVGVLAGGDSSGRVVGGAAGAALGGATAHALSPEKAKIARAVIGRMSESLPGL